MVISNKKLLINASNIHGGGALQVAISFFSDVFKRKPLYEQSLILISTKIADQISKDLLKATAWNYQIYDTKGISALKRDFKKKFVDYDLVFTLFGPMYSLKSSMREITGFAQPWIAYPDNEVYELLDIKERIKNRIKFTIQKLFFMKSDCLIVELEHVKERLVDLKICNSENIYINYNCLSRLYTKPEDWADVRVEKANETLSLGLISRDYPHKNIKILAEVAKILDCEHAIKAKFYFTLSENEWERYESLFGDYGSSVGEIKVDQCPSFYKKMDGIVFPSLLECFSATPLEALAMKVPLFVSDRAFVKNVCSKYAYYFDPRDASSIARTIAFYFSNQIDYRYDLEEGRQHSLNFSNPKNRVDTYLEIIKKEMELK